MKIVKLGEFDKNGNLTGWSLQTEIHDRSNTVWCSNDGIFIDEEGCVRVGGIEIVEWTEARKAAMEE